MSQIQQQIKAVVIGHAVADALGVPVEFQRRSRLDANPVCDMRGFGTYPYPAGCWSDDTSMTLAALDVLCIGQVDWDGIMQGFADWYDHGDYTPTGELFDIGNACCVAIQNYTVRQMPALSCGVKGINSNGNGSLMRIHPFVLFAHAKGMSHDDADELIAQASCLTHAHDRSILGCQIYACVLQALLQNPQKDSVYHALETAGKRYADYPEFSHYERIFAPDFAELARDEIKSSGYVVDTLEAAVWCLLRTDSYRDCTLMAVNLGEDTDTVAAVAGGLAGALYGYDAIPAGWLSTLKRLDYIEDMCRRAADSWSKNQ